MQFDFDNILDLIRKLEWDKIYDLILSVYWFLSSDERDRYSLIFSELEEFHL